MRAMILFLLFTICSTANADYGFRRRNDTQTKMTIVCSTEQSVSQLVYYAKKVDVLAIKRLIDSGVCGETSNKGTFRVLAANSEYAYAIQTVNGRDVAGHTFWVMTYSMVNLNPTTGDYLDRNSAPVQAPLPAYKRLTDAELKKQDEENSGD